MSTADLRLRKATCGPVCNLRETGCVRDSQQRTTKLFIAAHLFHQFLVLLLEQVSAHLVLNHVEPTSMGEKPSLRSRQYNACSFTQVQPRPHRLVS